MKEFVVITEYVLMRTNVNVMRDGMGQGVVMINLL